MTVDSNLIIGLQYGGAIGAFVGLVLGCLAGFLSGRHLRGR